MSTTDTLKMTRLPGPGSIEPVEPGDDLGPGEIITSIRPSQGWIAINWRELFHSHELFQTLVSRDLKIRYKQTVLGVAWAIIQPLFTMIVFTVIFGQMVGIKTGAIPYPMFVLAGLVPWTFFSNSVTGASTSLLTHQNLLTKIYFPRLYVPAATVGGFLVDLAIGWLLFAILMPFFGQTPGWGLLALPFVILLNFAAALGIGLVMAAATLLYRDLRFVVPFILQLGLYVSPVIFDTSKLARSIQYAAALNPMFGIINAYRASLLGSAWDLGPLAVSVASTVALLAFGLFFFRKTERLIADIV